MDSSFSHVSYNNGANNSVVYQDQLDINSSPTQQLNYAKPSQQHHQTIINSNNNPNNNLQRKSSLLYQHYTNADHNGSRIMSETVGNYTMGSDYYNNGNQSFSNINENSVYGNTGINNGDGSYWNGNTSINQSPSQQTSNLFNGKQNANLSHRNITAPVFKNGANSNGYAGYSPSAATTMVSGTLTRGAKSPTANIHPSASNNANSNLKRAISIKNNGLNDTFDSPSIRNESPFTAKRTLSFKNSAIPTNSVLNHEEQDNYKMELKIKDSQIESLEQEIETLKKMLKLKTSGTLKGENKKNELDMNNDATNNNTNTIKDALDIKNMESMDNYQDSFFFQLAKRNTNSLDDELYMFPEIPNSINELISRLSKRNEANNAKIKDLETRLDSLLTAVMMNPMNINGNSNILNNVPAEHGRYDEEAIAHKLVVRLETLTKENEEMGKMLSYGRSKEYQIDIKLLKRENEILKAKIKELSQKKVETK